MPAPATWTIRSMLEWCEGYLDRNGDEAPRRSAEVLVGKACGLERIELYLDMDRPLAPGELDVLREDVRNRGRGMPLQYITGTAPFRYLEVKVAPGVLIPRPETEVLVSEALALIPSAPKPQDAYDEVLIAALRASAEEGVSADAHDTADEAGAAVSGADGAPNGESAPAGDSGEPLILVADLCTGSGCIACSVATEHPRTRVIATDVSPEAVALARENAARCGVDERVRVMQGDLGECIDSSLIGRFDLVVSNPPYIPTGVLADIPREVADYEPALALDGGRDGLDLFRRIADWSLGALRPGGHLACELHETCLDAAREELERRGFMQVRVVEDLAGRPRVITARR